MLEKNKLKRALISCIWPWAKRMFGCQFFLKKGITNFSVWDDKQKNYI